jgi:predicted transcriptional regulator YdeE
VEKPKFWFNGHKIPSGNYTLFSHMKGRYPGITVRFFGGYPVRTLQFIPQVFDDKVERMKRQQKDWEYGMRTGFDMDYFKEYGIGTTTKEEDKIKEKMEG